MVGVGIAASGDGGGGDGNGGYSYVVDTVEKLLRSHTVRRSYVYLFIFYTIAALTATATATATTTATATATITATSTAGYVDRSATTKPTHNGYAFECLCECPHEKLTIIGVDNMDDCVCDVVLPHANDCSICTCTAESHSSGVIKFVVYMLSTLYVLLVMLVILRPLLLRVSPCLQRLNTKHNASDGYVPVSVNETTSSSSWELCEITESNR